MTSENKTIFTSDNKVFICGNFTDKIIEILPEIDKIIEQQTNLKHSKLIFEIDSNGGITDYLNILIAKIEKAKKLGIIVETNVYAKAYSCGSLLACAGTVGYRNVTEYAEHLCHLGNAGTGRVFTDLQLERSAARIKRHFDFVRSYYTKYAKIKDLEKVISDDDLIS